MLIDFILFNLLANATTVETILKHKFDTKYQAHIEIQFGLLAADSDTVMKPDPVMCPVLISTTIISRLNAFELPERRNAHLRTY
jgi:hypothetical protein